MITNFDENAHLGNVMKTGSNKNFSFPGKQFPVVDCFRK